MPFAFAAVLFDMDGVVVDTMPLHRRVWASVAREHGLAPTEAEIRALDGRRATDIIRTLFGAELPASEVERRAKARELLYRAQLETTELVEVPGIRGYLARLGECGIPRVLATSAVPGNMTTVLERLDLASFFDATVDATDVTRGKPDPEVYHVAAARAHVAPERCLVVEDALPGIEAAKAAGARCLGLATSESPERLRVAGADWVAPDFGQLPAELRP